MQMRTIPGRNSGVRPLIRHRTAPNPRVIYRYVKRRLSIDKVYANEDDSRQELERATPDSSLNDPGAKTYLSIREASIID